MARCRPAGEGGLDAGGGAPPMAADAAAEAGSEETPVPARGCAADAGDCGWTPGRLPGLVLWLDAGAGITVGLDGAVARWRDRSGLGNDAIEPAPHLGPGLVPAGASGRPLVVFGAPAGQQGLHLRVPDAPSLRWGRDPFAVVVVATSVNQEKAPGLLYRKRARDPAATGLQLLAEGHGEGRLVATLRPNAAPYDTIARSVTTGPAFSFGVRRSDGRTLELRVNGHRDGRVVDDQVDVDVSATGADGLLGAGGDEVPACCQLYGGIAEVIAVHGVLSDEDLARLDAYLIEKYALVPLDAYAQIEEHRANR
jgi:hypothetical protein